MPNLTENAPTDLSHLIAGDEQQPTQPMGNIYAPPVASDQAPGGAATPQTPATEGGAALPPEKHLNLTKVLLVAGIPIILVVAALSAYLILGVGKTAPETDTSLPVEQTETQAPLTNPPPQIVAPSPQAALPSIAPEPSTTDLSLPAPSSLVSPSPTSAMDKLKARQSPSPSPAASSSADSLSLPN